VKVKESLAILRLEKDKFCERFAWDLLANPVLNIKTAQYIAEEVIETFLGLSRRYTSNEDLHQALKEPSIRVTRIYT
jgi:hypothetical protein